MNDNWHEENTKQELAKVEQERLKLEREKVKKADASSAFSAVRSMIESNPQFIMHATWAVAVVSIVWIVVVKGWGPNSAL